MRFFDMDAPHGDVKAWQDLGRQAFEDGNFPLCTEAEVVQWLVDRGTATEDATAFGEGWEKARYEYVVNVNQHDLFDGRDV